MLFGIRTLVWLLLLLDDFFLFRLVLFWFFFIFWLLLLVFFITYFDSRDVFIWDIWIFNSGFFSLFILLLDHKQFDEDYFLNSLYGWRFWSVRLLLARDCRLSLPGLF